jgi:hypothetical protein
VAKNEKLAATRAAADAFEHYLRVRAHVGAMQAAAASVSWPPQEEQPLVAALAELHDATPDAIAELREHSKAITGVRRSHYRGAKADGVRASLVRDLERLLEKGQADLLVDEPGVLGGFGFRDFDKTYNEDTLRFFRVTSLLQDAALVRDFRDPERRRTVWEIGGGWGGFAYQFKTLCPNVTYLITGVPDLFLVSAVYLMTLFPNARVRFFDPAQPDAFWEDWHTVDLAFAPEWIVPRMQPPSLDLTLDVMTLERQRRDRIEMHVRRAYELGCRYFFSVGPAGDADAGGALPVKPTVTRWYWPHPVSTHAGLTKRLALGAGKRGQIERTYFLGWRRLRA